MNKGENDMLWEELTVFEKSLLLGSVLGDGTIARTRSKSIPKQGLQYREHFSVQQMEYREWKLSIAPRIFEGIKVRSTGTSAELFSRKDELFTWLWTQCYENRKKHIPIHLLEDCTHPVFLLALYLDDGSLSLTKSRRSKLNQMIITPHIYLYLQAFYPDELEVLSDFIYRSFHHQFVLSRRSDGHFFTLRIQKTEESIRFLNDFSPYAYAIPSMRKKLDWDYRLQLERENHLDMTIIASKAKNDYTPEEIDYIIQAKNSGLTDESIAKYLNRTYWSVVYKWQDIKKNHLKESEFAYVY